jgi:hypothetical protein
MFDDTAFAPDPTSRTAAVRLGAAVRKRRTLFWTIVFATLASLGLWALIAMGASALIGALFGT